MQCIRMAYSCGSWQRACACRRRHERVVAALTTDGRRGVYTTPASAVTLTLRSLSGEESAMQLQWSLTSDNNSAGSRSRGNDGSARGEYVTVRRSPYAVLRSRNDVVGRCVVQLLSAAPTVAQHETDATAEAATATGHTSGAVALSSCSSTCCRHGRLCCCAALLYPDTSRTPTSTAAAAATAATATTSNASSSSEGGGGNDTATTAAATVTTAAAVHDVRQTYTLVNESRWQCAGADFFFALHLAQMDTLLRRIVGDKLYTCLVRQQLLDEDGDGINDGGVNDNDDACGYADCVHVVPLCADTSPLLSRHVAWTMRTLLTTEESNRIRWLQEESTASSVWRSMQRCYARAPSLRALLVMAHIAAASWLSSSSTTTSTVETAATAYNKVDTNCASTSNSRGAATHAAAAAATAPSCADVRCVHARLRQRGGHATLCDVAALAVFAQQCSSAAPVRAQHGGDSGDGGTDDTADLQKDVLALLPSLVQRGFAVEHDGVDGSSSSSRRTHAQEQHVTASNELAAIFAALLACHYAQQQRQRLDNVAGGDVDNNNDDKDSHRLHHRVATSTTATVTAAAAAATAASSSSSSARVLPLPLLQLAEQLHPLRQRYACDDVMTSSSTLTAATTMTIANADTLSLSSSRVRHAVLQMLLQRFGDETHAAIARCDIAATHPQLREVTLWLLREQPTSTSCRCHFVRLAERSVREASAVLQSSGLLQRAQQQLPVLLQCVLPLLQLSRSEELCNTTLRAVLGELEQRLQRGVHAFSANELHMIAELGERAFVPPLLREAYASMSRIDQTTAAAATLSQQQQHNGIRAGGAHSATSSSTTTTAAAEERRVVLDVLTGGTRELCERACTYVAETLRTHVPSCQVLIDALTSFSSSMRAYQQQQQQQQLQQQQQPPPLMSAAAKPAAAVQEDKWQVNVSAALHDRYVAFIEQLVRVTVTSSRPHTAAGEDEGTDDGAHRNRSHDGLLHCHTLASFVRSGVVVPNIQDTYRRKLYLLVNVVDDGDGGSDGVPDELRLLVAALPYNFSSWASVAILREVLAASAGRNARYSFVLNAAMDLQLPVSTMRQRIATAQQLSGFLRTQEHKLTPAEYESMRKRCTLNVPLAYLLSWWSALLTSALMCVLLLLRMMNYDHEPRRVVRKLSHHFGPSIVDVDDAMNADNDDEHRSSNTTGGNGNKAPCATANARAAARQLASSYVAYVNDRDSINDVRVPVLVCIAASKHTGHDGGSDCCCVADAARMRAVTVGTLARAVAFPFYIELDKVMSAEELLARVACRIRRASLSSWSLGNWLIRRSPLDCAASERRLVINTCKRAMAKKRRMTFVLAVPPSVPLPPAFVTSLCASGLLAYADVVLIAHTGSLWHGRTNLYNSHVLHLDYDKTAATTAVTATAVLSATQHAMSRAIGAVRHSVAAAPR